MNNLSQTMEKAQNDVDELCKKYAESMCLKGEKLPDKAVTVSNDIDKEKVKVNQGRREIIGNPTSSDFMIDENGIPMAPIPYDNSTGKCVIQ